MSSGLAPGTVVVLTGASRGIGRALATRLAGVGARLVLGARDTQAIESLVSELRSDGHEAIAVSCDVTSPEDNERLASAALDEFGQIDVMIANAGIEMSRTVLKSDIDEWTQVINTNLVGTFLTTKAVLPAMKGQQRGQIVFLGSGVGHSPTIGRSAYGASKAAISHLARTLAEEVWRYGIAVNEFIPGPVETAMTAERFSVGEQIDALPSERVKSPDEAAAFVETLLRLGPDGPTGQVFSLARRPL